MTYRCVPASVRSSPRRATAACGARRPRPYRTGRRPRTGRRLALAPVPACGTRRRSPGADPIRDVECRTHAGVRVLKVQRRRRVRSSDSSSTRLSTARPGCAASRAATTRNASGRWSHSRARSAACRPVIGTPAISAALTISRVAGRPPAFPVATAGRRCGRRGVQPPPAGDQHQRTAAAGQQRPDMLGVARVVQHDEHRRAASSDRYSAPCSSGSSGSSPGGHPARAGTAAARRRRPARPVGVEAAQGGEQHAVREPAHHWWPT